MPARLGSAPSWQAAGTSSTLAPGGLPGAVFFDLCVECLRERFEQAWAWRGCRFVRRLEEQERCEGLCRPATLAGAPPGNSSAAASAVAASSASSRVTRLWVRCGAKVSFWSLLAAHAAALLHRRASTNFRAVVSVSGRTSVHLLGA